MCESFEKRPLPRSVLLSAAALVAFAFVAVSIGRFTDFGEATKPQAEALQSRDLMFLDRADGAVLVYEAGQETALDILEPGTNGFLRGVMRGVARERKLSNVSNSDPVRLTLWDDGRLTLDDLSTNYHVGLIAFGPTNAGAFARLLNVQRATN